MIFGIRINTDGSAFDQDHAAELARILRTIAGRLESGGFPAAASRVGGMTLRDSKGSECGRAAYLSWNDNPDGGGPASRDGWPQEPQEPAAAASSARFRTPYPEPQHAERFA